MAAYDHPLTSSSVPRDASVVLRVEKTATAWLQIFLADQVPMDLDDIGYRVINSDTKKFKGCVTNVGLLSRDRGDIHNDPNPWQKDKIKRHCAEDTHHTPSPYMSISVSPGRILNFLPCRGPNAEVAVFDMRLLQIMNSQVKRTTDLAHEHQINFGWNDEDRTPYITETHFLVHDFIPQCCIFGFISRADFERACVANGIDTDADPRCTQRLSLDALRGYLKPVSAYRTDPDFMTTNVTPAHHKHHRAPAFAPATPPASPPNVKHENT